MSDEAKECRLAANDLFKRGLISMALDKYTECIDLLIKNLTSAQQGDNNSGSINNDIACCYANRSLANMKLEMYGSALTDASKAIEYDPTYIKGYYRRAAAYMALGKHKLALDDLRKIAATAENDKFVHSKIKACEKIIHQIRFEKAISVDSRNSRPLAYTIDCDSLAVEGSYRGPHLDESGKVTLDFIHELINHYKEQKILHKKYALKILCNVYDLFAKSPTLIDLTVPSDGKITICGDIHGQFYDLLHIFELNGLPSETNPYLFNGDVVDRGSWSIECILLLLSFKLLYPNHFYITRGNHEAHSINQIYGFQGECRVKYSQTMYELFTEVFQVLPLAYCINERVLVMHGGLFSSDDVTLDDIRKIDRNRQPPDEGLMCELLWSDPMPQDGRAMSKRGIAIQFGPDVTEKFCQRNNLDYIIRSHEAKTLGYERAHNNRCITIFSAPNYCDSMGNDGAFIRLSGSDLSNPEFVQFQASPHPDLKPMAYANPVML
ncbi:Serine/threonine-protein phosphatase 5 [Fragariocoptes setiger]|uniref:protein-serine/threonine phosphatase n=1 Tax=Fragariocoptes setiger TaxID=1670756 RepID=A0ABQ7S8Q9_9ACAR|nr:Serine/threonine-protein phosphatase 5 [Fragariocoptes setiger]